MALSKYKPECTQNSPSCMDDFDPASMDADQALQQILNQVDSINKTEIITIREALNRVLAEDIFSAINTNINGLPPINKIVRTTSRLILFETEKAQA